MRVWERTRITESCGGCGGVQQPGVAVQVVALQGVSKRRIRCEACADGPVDIEQLERFDIAEEGRTSTVGMTRVGLAASAFDFKGVTRALFDAKMAATGERD